MTGLDDINQKAWEIAALSIMLKSGRFETYSNGQIRGFFELAKSKDFEKGIDAHIKGYTPQPSRGQRPQDIEEELQEMKKRNESIANNIKAIFKNLKPAERMRFSQYLMWNIKIIEQRMPKIEEIKLVLDCERIKDPKVIIDHLTAISRTDHVRTPRKSERRERYQDRRR
ncbi:hypothetical protein ANME2D_00445 [Candidatus Methanoperedens nitroreducens]|uniref:Uncharacterized protein n=1 Tax=Candidatus Methanoperedens nitratireducens TaxID=1392998 RepID=A0A062VCH3_9EURY|nr:hypothetical protein [Candidatus Methanoperedens nitroreducens]KCZ73379.1 hypothetical protein ANME2D_00445 [Candidatus Methanoperedens nitroreducens]MDJ1422670.1 hypothetical protein [Candidatus Methanoperedens sp.]